MRLHCHDLPGQPFYCDPKLLRLILGLFVVLLVYFDDHLDGLSQDQLLDYFHSLLEILSWNAVKLDLYKKLDRKRTEFFIYFEGFTSI